jgi:hypothetical protein
MGKVASNPGEKLVGNRPFACQPVRKLNQRQKKSFRPVKIEGFFSP